MNRRSKVIVWATAAALVAAGTVGGFAIANSGAPEAPAVVEPTPTFTPTPTVSPTPTPTPTAEPAPAPEPVVEAPAPPPPAPIRCPAGSQANSNDGVNDTGCYPVICFSIAVPNPDHPECDAPFKP